VKTQNKEAEIAAGSTTPPDEWLENPLVIRIKKRHLELLQLIPSQNQLILDAGCGPGTYGIILAQAGNDVIGIDISSQEIEMAKERGKQKGVSFSPMVGDLERLPFKDSSFDICFCGWVLHHFPDTDAAIAELSRVVKSGGRIAMAEPAESNLAVRFSRFVENLLQGSIMRAGWDTPNRTTHMHKDYIEALKRQGFTDIRISSCFPGGLPPLPIKSQKRVLSSLRLLLIHILFRLRTLFFTIASRVLPRPLNGADLLIAGTKK
jgi:ubiquinone/menaquinone biosynthesis C-methylase UbiE